MPAFGGGDLGSSYRERTELYEFVRDQRIEGFVTVSGDRHSFWAGYAAKDLLPCPSSPSGSRSSAGPSRRPVWQRRSSIGLKDHPLRPLFTVERENARYESTVNLTLKRGVRSALEYARSGDLVAARSLTNPDNAPHLEFIDMGGHGYAVVTAKAEGLADRVRLHPASHQSSPEPRWRTLALSRHPHRSTVARRRAPQARAALHRGSSGPVHLTHDGISPRTLRAGRWPCDPAARCPTTPGNAEGAGIARQKPERLRPLQRVGETGFEPATPWSRTKCSTRLSHSPRPTPLSSREALRNRWRPRGSTGRRGRA